MRDLQKEIITFWFEQTKPAQWFQINPAFDELVRQQFESAYDLARRGMLSGWRESPEGCLAFIILLDQFSRNMFRSTAKAFESDAEALDTARYAISKHFDKSIPAVKRSFIYLPFEHSEDMEDQSKSVDLFASLKEDNPLGYDYACSHKRVIEKFGRFPARNQALGRVSTAEEVEYLSDPRRLF